ncbi:MAG: fibrobacter succinogenes major paralogous domain-containing protein [Sediminibacterium sp.]|nr:fibrobacter succinogenes major paralogous domain-containing protein [Sediminibacterium sp.]
MGNQIWMARNLNVSWYNNGDTIPEVQDGDLWSNLTTGAWSYYNNDNTNSEIYEKLYNWYAVNDSRGICPVGWHVPSDADWTTLNDYLGGNTIAGYNMKSINGWDNGGNGDNSSGFNAYPGGLRFKEGYFYNAGSYGIWWTSTIDIDSNAWYRYINSESNYLIRDKYEQGSGLSVRCIKNYDYFITASAINGTISFNGTTGYNNEINEQIRYTWQANDGYRLDSVLVNGVKVDSINGYTFNERVNSSIIVKFKKTFAVVASTNYGTISSIGTVRYDSNTSVRYTWQADSEFVLDSVKVNGIKVDSVDGYTFFVNADNTIQVIFKFQPQSVTIGTQIWMAKNLNVNRYRNGDSIPEVQDTIMWSNLSVGAWSYNNNDTVNSINYGKLYNGYAVIDSRGLCPVGWHAPSNTEWSILTNYLGGDSIVGYKIKSTDGWDDNGNGENSIGFNGLPNGFRLYDGSFYIKGSFGVWWSSTIDNDNNLWYNFINSGSNNIAMDKFGLGNGFSVRCLKDYNYFINASAINGTITLNGTTGFNNNNNSVRYTWQANTGYELDSVFVNGNFVDSVNGYTFLVNKNYTIKVLFKIKTYLVNARVVNGTIRSFGSIRYDSNSSVRYTWQANPGYELDSVIVQGLKVDSINGYTFNVNENTAIRVLFKIKKFTVTTSAENGIISPIGINSYDSNTIVRYTWQANKNTVLDSVLVNGIKVDSTLGYTLRVSKNSTVVVKFRKWGLDSVKLLNIMDDTIAYISVKIIDSGISNIIKKGIIWNTTAQVSFTKKIVISNRGVGMGNFIDTMKVLQQAKKYFYRGYFINAKDTAISNVDSFISISSVTIGTQVWMARNLNISRYQNGDIIPQIQVNNTWANLNTGAWSNYYNDSFYGTKYGKLYNWYAVNDNRGLCPLGWHVPTDAEFTTLNDYLGGGTIAINKLKSTMGWVDFNGNNSSGDNSSGFNGLPVGSRDNAGNYFGLNDGFAGYDSKFWSSSNVDNVTALYRNLDNIGSFRSFSENQKYGFVVRCIKDHGYFIISNATNGIITPAGTNKYDSSATPRYTWQAKLGYELDSVLVNGIKVDSINGYTFKKSENSSISVSFKIKKYTVNASVINGILTPIGTNIYDSNSKVRYTWQANTGYVLDSVNVNGVKVDSTLGYTLLVSKNTNLVVKFRKKPIVDTIKFIEILYDTAAVISVKIVDSGASNIIKKGIIWDSTLKLSFTKKIGITNKGASIANFIDTINGLQQALKYYYRGYIINKKDTALSNIDSFISISTVTIGTQTWMARNLNVSTYQNGDIIPQVQSSFYWVGLNIGAWCNFNNDVEFGSRFGKLYNWYVTNDPRGVCPVGWHVPTDDEFTTLADYLGGEDIAGNKLKSTTGWLNASNGDNSSGFNGYPSGYRLFNSGNFWGIQGDFLGNIGFWWNATSAGNGNGWSRTIYDLSNILKYENNPKNGFSVRCIKNHGFSITANATNGTITPAGTNWYDSNRNPRYTWQANTGYELDSVIINGIKVDSINGYTFKIFENSTINVVFKVKKFTVIASALNGVITPTGTSMYDTNTKVRYTWQANKNYVLDSVLVHGVKVDSTKGYTLLLTKNATIVVKFKKWTVDSIRLLNILNDSAAVISVKIIDTGSSNIIKKGIIWDTTLQISFTKKIGISNKGAGNSNFIDTIKNLQPYIKYYYRGYLINSKDTAVSNIDSFVSISTVTIGSQVWMARNLNVITYKNGDAISQVTDINTWSTLNTGAWCNYNNNTTLGARLGKLYNWYAVNDSRGLCPVGWHVPTDAEFTALSNYLGGDNVAGNKIKSTTGWFAGTEGNNSSGFNGLVSGIRHYSLNFLGIVNHLSNNATWWSSSNIDNTNALNRYVGNGTGFTQANENQKNGFAVRCLQDHNYTIIANATNGTITPTGTNIYDSNISVRYTWKATGGYELDSVIINGVKVDSVNGYTFTIKENSTIKVVFKLKKFTVTSSAINGIINPVGIGSYDSGTKVRYTWQANTGYVIDSVNVNGIKVDSSLGFTLSVSKNTTMVVKFRKKPIVDSVKFIEIMYDTAAIVSVKIGDTGASNILKKGVIWDTSTRVSFTKKMGITNYGAGNGDFIDTIKGLHQAKKYYYRGYIINKKDTAISYIDSFIAISYVTIGAQTWMARNLNVSTYQNGDIIPQVQNSNIWVGLNTGAWCNYEDNGLFSARFGKLYNWYTVNDPRGLCPVGWHVPTDADFTTLTDYLGGENEAPNKLKSTIGWLNNGNGDNSSGFNGFAGGFRYYAYGNYVGLDNSFLGNIGIWWTSSMLENGNAWARFLYDIPFNIKNNENPKNGFSVRCIKEHGYTITASATNGIISKLGTNWYDSNTNIRYTWEANTGYELDSVIVNGIKVDSVNGYSFTIRNNNTIKVVFKIKKYNVTASAVNGVITPTGNSINDSNTKIRYTWQANKGYFLDSLIVNGVKVDSILGYTLFVSKNTTILVKCRIWNLDSINLLNIIADTVAAISVKIEDSGASNIIKKGIIWDTTVQISFTKKIGISNKGIGNSNFVDTINGLQQAKKYYYRAYLINSNDTVLSKIDSFISISTVKIGTQTWMARNLNVSTYKNGDLISQIQDGNTWPNLNYGAWCNFNNIDDYAARFGKLYNWYAVNDSRGVCPIGWHVPTDAEFTTLTDYLGGISIAGYKLKSTTGWDAGTEGDNSSGFNALPGGFRYYNPADFHGPFNNFTGGFGYWWTASKIDNGKVWYRFLAGGTNIDTLKDDPRNGFSVRCLKDYDYKVTANAINGTITPIGTNMYYVDTKIRYNWQANPGYELDSVIVNGTKVDSINGYTFELNGNIKNNTIKIIFKLKTYTVVASSFNGTITPIGTNRYDSNTKVRYTWQANPGYELDSVIVNGIKVDSLNGYTIRINKNDTILVLFKIKKFTVTASVVNGLITPAGINSYDSNTKVRYTWHANHGYELDSLIVNGIKVDSLNEYTITINKNSTIRVLFKIKKFTVTASAENGLITPTGTNRYDSNTNVRYTWQANVGYTLDSVFVDGIKVDSTLSYTLLVFKNTNIIVKFRKKPILDTVILLEVINDNAASIAVNIIDTGVSNIIKKGIIWGLTQQISFNNNIGISNKGGGIDNFIDTITGLQQTKKYYYRVYLINEKDTTFSDIYSFNSISTVTIGTQVWMARNLEVNTYQNGDIIPEIQVDIDWYNATTGAWSYYDYDSVTNGGYGKLYNWYTISDSRGVCPVGWRVPSTDDLGTLSEFLGGANIAGYKLKSTSGWDNNGSGDNSSGFNALPGGLKFRGGVSSDKWVYGTWWTSSLVSGLPESDVYYYFLYSESNYLGGGGVLDYYEQATGLSIRCIKN